MYYLFFFAVSPSSLVDFALYYDLKELIKRVRIERESEKRNDF